MRARGPDPFVVSPRFEADLEAARVVRIKADFGGRRGPALKVYYVTEWATRWCEEQSLEAVAPADDGPVTLTFDFARKASWRGSVLRLRIDIERMGGGDVEIELCEVALLSGGTEVRDVIAPPLPPFPGEEFHLLFEMLGQRLGNAIPEPSARFLSVLGQTHPARFRSDGPGTTVRAAYRLAAQGPGIADLTLAPIGPAGSLVTELWVRDPEAERREAATGLALDSEVVTIDDGSGRVAVRVVPEVVILWGERGCLRRASIPLSRPVSAGEGVLIAEGSRRIQGREVRFRMSVGPPQNGEGCRSVPWTVSIEAPTGVWIRDLTMPRFVLGDPNLGSRRQLALLPGVELLGEEGLPEGDALWPEPIKVAWPLVAMEQDGLVHAVRFGGADLSVRWVSPDVWSGTPAHHLSLHLPIREEGRAMTVEPWLLRGSFEVRGEIVVSRVRCGETLITLGRRLCPEPPELDLDEALRHSVEALAQSFRGPRGLTLPHIGADPDEEYFELRACLSMVAATRRGLVDLESAARAELDAHAATDGGWKVPLDVGLLFPELMPQAIEGISQDARELASTLRADGTWPPAMTPGCLYPYPERLARSAAAIAEPARRLLVASLLGLGDDEAARTSCARLSGPSLLPTGGQAWEFSPETPDVLGAAAVADALLTAWEAGIDPEGLERALDWLSLGLTFFRFPSQQAEPFACIPALGVTRSTESGALWYAWAPDDQLDWRGLCCPWVGVRFAGSLERFRAAAARGGGDVRSEVEEACELFAKISRGTLAHSLGHLRADGSLPDGFLMARGVETETEPLYRAPFEIAWHAATLLGACPEATVVRGEGFAVAATGLFRRCEGRLEMTPHLPGRQGILLRGRITAHEGAVALRSVALRDGLAYATISGTETVTLAGD